MVFVFVPEGANAAFFVVNETCFAPTLGPVVVVRRNLQLQRIEVPLIHAIVEVDKVRLVLVDKFDISLIPVHQEAFHRRIAAVRVVIKIRPLGIVEIGVFGLHLLG